MTAAETTPIFALSDSAVSRLTADDPCLAMLLGLPDVAPSMTDFSPDGISRRRSTTADLLDLARTAAPTGPADEIAAAVMVERLENLLTSADAGDPLRDINILSSPPQVMRMTLEILPPDHPDEQVAAWLHAVAPGLRGWQSALQEGMDTGLVAARRQAVAVAEQLVTYADSWFAGYARARGDSQELRDAASVAAAAARDGATWLADVYAPAARAEDAVGEDAYGRAVRYFNGLDLDLDETFTWGWEEVERLTGELRREAARIDSSVVLEDLRALLDADERYQIHGVPALVEHLEYLTTTATDAVDGTYFDIDPRVRECGVAIAGEGAAAAPYYQPPSEDLSRPGCTWFPTRGRTVFPRWWATSVWYHEGVPGHHLQLGAIAAQDRMSRFQRLLGMTSGYGEGWALYAERFADDLGWFDEPGTRIGFLSGQLLRAVRVVVDIGMHTGRTVPAGHRGAGSAIDATQCRRLLQDLALVDPEFAASEVDRYLGMPGQAISYKVGERFFLEARDSARSRLGAEFSLKDWHMAGITLGPMGLAQFRTAMADPAR